jgi:hypothetical protein
MFPPNWGRSCTVDSLLWHADNVPHHAGNHCRVQAQPCGEVNC